MLIGFKRGQTSIVLRVKILDSSVSTGAGKTGLTFSSTGLIISTIADNEASPTAYTVAGSTIETITTLGTYATPTATKCRFKEVDSTNHKGVYEIQIADARFAVSSAKSLLVSISGASGAADCDVVIPLTDINFFDAVRAGLTALPNANAAAANGLPILGANASAISFTGGMTISNASGDALTLSSGGSNGNGLNASGNGTGAGVKATGGATGHGVSATGGSTSGDGINAAGATSGHGITATGVGTTKHGINAAGGSTTSHGISATGGGVGHGILATSGSGATGDGFKAVAASTNGNGINAAGVGTGAGTLSTGGATGPGINGVGGSTSGSGIKGTGSAGNAIGLEAQGQGSAAGFQAAGGATGPGQKVVGGSTSGDGFAATATSGHGMNLAGNGASKHGLLSTGGSSGTSDGIKGAAGSGGVDIRGNITGDITGNVSKIKKYLQLLARKDAAIATDNATELTELNASGGSGAGTFDNTTDSHEALFDDAANLDDFGIMVSTTIATLTSQTVGTLTAGSANDNAYNGCPVVLINATTNVQKAVGFIDSYVGSTKQYTLRYDPGIFTVAAGDKIVIMAPQVCPSVKRNKPLNNFEFAMIDSTDNKTGKTGLTVTATRSIDGGAFASCANAVTEIANGVYKISLAAADLNGNVITLRFTGTGANDSTYTLVTEP